MDVYFAPLACSLATRIALYEANAPARFIYVDLQAKRTEAGEDFLAINPVGQVPAVRLESGEVFTENSAILSYLADRFGAAGDALSRAQLARWIGFINSELHTGAFTAILDEKSPAEAKAYALERAASRMKLLDAHLKGREFLLDHYSVADGYLLTIMNWTQVRGPALSDYPALNDYIARLRARPAIAKALGEELPLYFEEQKRRAA
ncbi:MAG: glutathione binding-like protein [Hyphomonadaceae bacterium]